MALLGLSTELLFFFAVAGSVEIEESANKKMNENLKKKNVKKRKERTEMKREGLSFYWAGQLTTFQCRKAAETISVSFVWPTT